MKKIEFSRRKKGGTCEAEKTKGYYFKVFDYYFVVHKVFNGWRVSELTSGCGITKFMPTRKKAMECFVSMQKEKYNGLDFSTALKQCASKVIEKYGKANEIER